MEQSEDGAQRPVTAAPWDAQNTATLIRLFSEGVSAKNIGREINKSRNAVIGKAKRLGLFAFRATFKKQTAREGQARFRAMVMEAFNETCCVTGCRERFAVEAAHIVPYAVSADHAAENGLCLRADIHALFDCDKLSIRPDFTILLAEDVTDPAYAELHGSKIELPLALDKFSVSANLALRIAGKA